MSDTRSILERACDEMNEEAREARVAIVKRLLARKEKMLSDLVKLNDEVAALNSAQHNFRIEYSSERCGNVLVCEGEYDNDSFEHSWPL